MKVTCINDKNQPEGAEVVKGNDYIVEREYINGHGQKVFILEGVNNGGTTPRGLVWQGYSAQRFSVMNKEKESAVQFEYAMN